MTRRTLAVVSAGLSQPSSSRLLAGQLAAGARRGLPGGGGGAVGLRGPAPAHPHNLLTGFPPAGLREALDTVARADGLIAVTPIFNASYSGLFKSFFDVVEEGSLADKPVLIAATGGTARHSLALEHALRPLFSYLHAVVVPTAVFAAPEDWGGATAQGALASRINRAAGELAREISRREPVTVIDPFDEPTPFEELLAS
ncbi:NAD(P)H-dependent oxidoreductase [Micromonospora sp. CPCC 205371]|nr:NAD(P)H-dependent oxidoreductase [Micromonospora sp. CPCC 205371]